MQQFFSIRGLYATLQKPPDGNSHARSIEMKKRKSQYDEELTFGEILSRHRNAQKYSLRELAELSGVSASYLSRLEKGEASATYEVIAKIADALGLKPEEFFPGHGGFKPSYREEFGQVLESRPVQAMLRALATLDPYAQRAIAVATTHWIELLKRGLHPVDAKGGVYKLNDDFVEEMEEFRGFKTP
jgi:transcriptional regulator with XRE-family HTH domain